MFIIKLLYFLRFVKRFGFKKCFKFIFADYFNVFDFIILEKIATAGNFNKLLIWFKKFTSRLGFKNPVNGERADFIPQPAPAFDIPGLVIESQNMRFHHAFGFGAVSGLISNIDCFIILPCPENCHKDAGIDLDY